jgi:hypothetical protein
MNDLEYLRARYEDEGAEHDDADAYVAALEAKVERLTVEPADELLAPRASEGVILQVDPALTVFVLGGGGGGIGNRPPGSVAPPPVTNEQAKAWPVRSDDAGRLAKALLESRAEVERLTNELTETMAQLMWHRVRHYNLAGPGRWDDVLNKDAWRDAARAALPGEEGAA